MPSAREEESMNVRNAATCFDNRRPGVGTTRASSPSRGNIQRGLLRKGPGAAAGPRPAGMTEGVAEPPRLQREPQRRTLCGRSSGRARSSRIECLSDECSVVGSLHSSFFILHSSFFILHSFILHSSFYILYSIFSILSSSILHSLIWGRCGG